MHNLIFQPFHHILFHEQYHWSINWDLKVDPLKYLEMDRQTLSKASDSSPKIIRTVRQNKSPVLLKSDYALNTENYSKIGKDEINRRVKILDDNPKFIELREYFEESINSKFELGAAISIEIEGESVINLWGGYQDANRSRAWQEDTLCNTFSVSK